MTRLRQILAIADRLIARLEAIVLVVTFALLGILTGLQVLGRQFDLPTTWTLELAAYLLVWLIFTGASLGVREWQHVRFDAVLELFSGRVRRIIDVAIELTVLGFVVFLAITASHLVERQLAWGQRTATLPVNVSIAFTAVIIPISAVFMAVHIGQRLFGEKRKTTDGEEVSE